MVLHKDSKWFQGWQNFKENNQYVNSNLIYLIKKLLLNLNSKIKNFRTI